MTNLVHEHIESVVNLEGDMLAGCALDYSSVIVGGNPRFLRIFDLRMKRGIFAPIKIDSELIQVTAIERFTDS